MSVVPALLILCVFLCVGGPCRPVMAVEESMCAGVGFSNDTVEDLGSISMGATLWKGNYSGHIWAGNKFPESQITIDHNNNRLIVMDIKRVLGHAADGTRRTLSGWLRINFIRLGTIAVAIWAVTENDEPFGRFMYKLRLTSTPCKDVDKTAIPSEILPCSGTPVDAPLNPNMFVWHTDSGGRFRGISLLWKADTSVGSFDKSFRFMIVYSGTEGLTVQPISLHAESSIVITTNTFYPRFYGPAAPIYDTTVLECDGEEDWVSIADVEWLREKVLNTTFGNKDQVWKPPDPWWYSKRWLTPALNENLSVVQRRHVCKIRKSGFQDFGGRCKGTQAEARNGSNLLSPDFTTPPRCLDRKSIKDDEFDGLFEHHNSTTLMQFQHYLYSQRHYEIKRPCPCPAVPTLQQVKDALNASAPQQGQATNQGQGARARAGGVDPWMDAQVYQDQESGCKQYIGTKYYDKHGLCLQSVVGQYVQGVRQWHGISNLLVCMVIIPISCFMARYLKGPIPVNTLTGEPLIAMNAWYVAHASLILPVTCMYVTSMSAIERQKNILGRSRSKAALIHRTCGYILFGLFGFQILTGFLRPLNVKWRKLCIFLHWACGYALHYGGAIVCILTYRIPASPFAFQKAVEHNFHHVTSHVPAVIMIVWVSLDLILHVGITVCLVRYDRNELEETRRTYIPVILPLPVSNFYLRSLRFDEIRREQIYLQKTFYWYCAFCAFFFFVILTTTLFLNFEQVTHGYGSMECTHDAHNRFNVGPDTDLKEQAKFCKF